MYFRNLQKSSDYEQMFLLSINTRDDNTNYIWDTKM